MSEENVKVAVRVRPFGLTGNFLSSLTTAYNKREKDRNAKLVVHMNGNVTTITDPQNNKNKSFAYDYSYWSFDGFKENSDGYMEVDPTHTNGNKYCDQNRVYGDLGKGILTNAWAGYNATLFAYGQTGSGKSWSVIGYGANKGIVPLVCEELFKGIQTNTEDKQFEVRFSMLEIYNEIVRDLLTAKQVKAGLKIRQHPKKGFYAEGLSKALVMSNEEIGAKMEEGTLNRTIRSTNMNATSSRAHTIVTITFIQKFMNARGQETAKSAVINLVDLAGSERVESTGATGERLKEAAAINLSLTSLGNVINALVKKLQGESVRIPYRDSSLTKLLKNALGGNSKTVMIAAISPADINYDETVSTLNFADRAKQIKTKAVVNEDPTEKLIRELKEENERLKKKITTGKIDEDFIDEDGDGIDDRDAAKLRAKWEEEVKARMRENENEMFNMKKTYEEKLKLAAKCDMQDPSIKQKLEEKLRKPHIYNLNSDSQLSGKIIHILKSGQNTLGNRKGKESDITMIGPSIQENHANLTVDKKGNVNLVPCTTDCKILVNGDKIQRSVSIKHNDRLMFGTTQIWLFQNPLNKKKPKEKTEDFTFEFAMDEITAKTGIKLENEHIGPNLTVLQDELHELLPAVEEANSISEELDKKVKFEILILSPEMVGATSDKTAVYVKLKNFDYGTDHIWPRAKFLDRLYKMREMYNEYIDSDEWLTLSEDFDPFQESSDAEIHIGTVSLPLRPLAHMVEVKESLEIITSKSIESGLLNIEIVPCNKVGKEYSEKEDVFLDYADQLTGRDLYFLFKIQSGSGLPSKYTDFVCSFHFYLNDKEYRTKIVSDTTNPIFNFENKFTFKPVTAQLVEYLENALLPIKVLGKHRLRRSKVPQGVGLSTREMLKNDQGIFAKNPGLHNNLETNGKLIDPQRQSIIVELLLMKKTQARLQQRVDNITKLIKEAENTSRIRVSTTLLREVMNAPTPDQADSIIRKKLADESDHFKDAGGRYKSQSQICSML